MNFYIFICALIFILALCTDYVINKDYKKMVKRNKINRRKF